MRVRLVIDGATYEFTELEPLQFDAIVKLLESMSDCTLYPTGTIAEEDQRLAEGQTDRHARALEKLLTEKDNEIARRIEAFTRAVNANGELTRRVADLIGDVALAKAEKSGLHREIKELRAENERLIAELDAARFALPAQPTAPLPPPVYVPYPYPAYPPPWYWPAYVISCTTNTGTLEAKQP